MLIIYNITSVDCCGGLIELLVPVRCILLRRNDNIYLCNYHCVSTSLPGNITH